MVAEIQVIQTMTSACCLIIVMLNTSSSRSHF